jgi:transcriptional regulator with XRE-family HTH domain
MRDSMPRGVESGHANTVDLTDAQRSSLVDLAEMRAWINRAIDESGWNQEALAAHLHKDKAYVSRVLSGEKSLSAAFIRELPDDIEALVAGYYAESFGLVVVAPSRGQDALKNLVSGLLGVLAPQLPVRASAMVKVNLDVPVRKRGVR